MDSCVQNLVLGNSDFCVHSFAFTKPFLGTIRGKSYLDYFKRFYAVSENP